MVVAGVEAGTSKKQQGPMVTYTGDSVGNGGKRMAKGPIPRAHNQRFIEKDAHCHVTYHSEI